MLTYFFIAAGAILLIWGGVGYFKYLNWKKNGAEATAVYEELVSCEEKQAGPLNRKPVYYCKYRTEITSGGRITHGSRQESFESKAETKKILGKKLKGLKDAAGEFLDMESVDALRRTALGRIYAGIAGFAIALLRILIFKPF